MHGFGWAGVSIYGGSGEIFVCDMSIVVVKIVIMWLSISYV